MAFALLVSVSTFPGVSRPTFTPGVHELPACRQYSNSYGGYIRCLKNTAYEICDLTEDLYRDLEESMKARGGVLGLDAIAPQNLHCENLGMTYTKDEVLQKYPTAQYCALDKKPGDEPYDAHTVPIALEKREDTYAAYMNKAVIMRLKREQRFLLATETCNVVWY